jgi:hypothetical protein
MNRRNVTRAVLFMVVAAFSLGSGCSTGKGDGQPPATAPESGLAGSTYGCHFLELYVTNTHGTVVSTPYKGVTCKHGHFKRATPTASDVHMVSMSQSSSYGPDCSATFNANNQTYVVRVQQNYCYWEAGTITASVTSGNAVISGTQEGSFSSGTPGSVSVRLN